MTESEYLVEAREAVRRASDVAGDAAMREKLDSIDEGLMEMTESGERTDNGPKTSGDVPHGDNLESVEERLTEVADAVDDPARAHVEDARDAIDAYRRAYTRDW